MRLNFVKILLPGFAVSLVLGFGLSMPVGVNAEDPIPNYIGVGVGSFVPILLNSIVSLVVASKEQGQKPTIGKAMPVILACAVLGVAIGVGLTILVVEGLIGIKTTELTQLNFAAYQAVIRAILATKAGYLVVRKNLAKNN